MLDLELVKKLVKDSLQEDLGSVGDITSNLTIPKNTNIDFVISNREDIILCGIDLALEAFNSLGSDIEIKSHLKDGEFVPQNSEIIRATGDAHQILAAERVALNFLQHLSGIASKTNLYVKEIEGSKAKILDTRKTLPNYRILQKYAVKMGGGENHRFGLYDAILIKDNHIEAAGGVVNAIKQAKSGLQAQNKELKIEIECDHLSQIEEALSIGVDIIMIDNMSLENTKKAVEIIGSKAKIEASGGINLKNIKEIAFCGVDYISVGSLTHSSRAVDIGLDIVQQPSK